MGQGTGIEWATDSWHPITGGCMLQKISPGCKYCWAERTLLKMNERFGKSRVSLELKRYPEKYAGNKTPLKWPARSPARRIFACGMTDLFQDQMPPEWVQEVFDTIQARQDHTFIILTKRPHNIPRLVPGEYLSEPPGNLWLGVSVEGPDEQHRVDTLKFEWTGHRVVSYEPLLKDLQPAEARGLGWVIIGGESDYTGPRAMPMGTAYKLIEYYKATGVPVFMKQMGTAYAREHKLHHGRGADILEWPEEFQVRQFPQEMLRPRQARPGGQTRGWW
jgi:protein gp37